MYPNVVFDPLFKPYQLKLAGARPTIVCLFLFFMYINFFKYRKIFLGVSTKKVYAIWWGGKQLVEIKI